ncbi:replicative DNA helicase [Malaciobacter marinus]|uniref:replicative DNA helicase n=1 Tax=Malaciobacter marinus TaxID=505249 RepID=UPI0009A579EB|nr:replicative DNA helicase [Malaciobacter marinus]SKB26984.1 replicative DNA helicase [Malaciobacter marinus]
MDSVYSINIERAVLSSILFNPDEIEEILSMLKPKDFYLPAHQKIFEVMSNLYRDDMPVDEDFIRKKISTKDVDDSILIEILSANPITNTIAYVKEIKDGSVKRELASLATTIKKVSIEEDIPANEALDTIQGALYKISTDSATSELKDMQEITGDTLSYIKKMKELGNQHLIGETTGFHDLDKRTTGFNEGDLVIIAARPAMGKCLGRGTKVVMYDGTLKNVEDIKVGDQLMGDDSTPRNVLSTTKGVEQMYWVRQNKAIDYRVNESHILSLKRSRTEGPHKNGDILNVNIKEYLEKSEKFKSNYKGYKVAVEFENKELIKENREKYFKYFIKNNAKIKDSYYFIEEKLIDEKIKFLADSLGYVTFIEDKNLFISIEKSKTALTGIKIEKDIVDEYYGFEIDGNRLFLLEDMTVTHNTALVLNMALANVEAGKGVVFFSLEMPAEQLMLRMLAAKTSIPLQNLRKGDMDDDQWSNLSRAFEDLNQKKLFVDDGGSVNINQLRARVRKLAQNDDNNISMVVIDYLQLMQGTGNKDRHQEVSDISRGLKMLAREMKIPIIALSQLNRGLENRPDKRPMLSDLRESGAIEQDADIIMFVYRDDVYKERDEARKEKEAKDKGEEYKSTFVNKAVEEAEIIIGKQRNGPIGTVKLEFQKQYTRFVNKQSNSEAPIEVVFESVADTNKETNIDVPQIL